MFRQPTDRTCQGLGAESHCELSFFISPSLASSRLVADFLAHCPCVPPTPLILVTCTAVASGRAGDVETPLLRESVILRMLEHDAADSFVWDFPMFRDYDEYIW